MLWYKLPWSFILWSCEVAPNQDKYQDLFNLMTYFCQQSSQIEANSYFNARYSLLTHATSQLSTLNFIYTIDTFLS